jgi:hypothetical protein
MLTPRRAQTLLRCLLVFNGLLTISALPAVFLSTAWMDVFHRQLGLGPLPPGTIVQYLARSLSAFYVAYGTLTLVLAWDVARHAPLVTWWGTASITLGVLLFGVDRLLDVGRRGLPGGHRQRRAAVATRGPPGRRAAGLRGAGQAVSPFAEGSGGTSFPAGRALAVYPIVHYPARRPPDELPNGWFRRGNTANKFAG